MKMAWLEKLVVNSSPWNAFIRYTTHRPFLKHIQEEPKKILEIGCGIGKTSQMIAERFPEATIIATDYDEKQIKEAQRKASKNITFKQEDAHQLSFSDKTFDAVFVFMAFHHMEDYRKALRECYRVLKTGGMLYVLDLGKYSIHRLPWIVPAPVVFSKEEFAASVRKEGFEISQASGNNIRFFITAKVNI